MMTLRRALYKSKNLPAILTGMKYGLSNVVNYARKFGIKRAPLQAVPSLALGSVGATLMEMTSAYTVFPNGGNRIEPYMIESIVDRNGEVVEKNSKVEHEVLRPASLLDGRYAQGRERSRYGWPCVGFWFPPPERW